LISRKIGRKISDFAILQGIRKPNSKEVKIAFDSPIELC
jgi:hypothetical protein